METECLFGTWGRSGGPGKLRTFWEQDVNTVVDCKGEAGAVYSIKPDNNEKRRIMTVHKNMLLPCKYLRIDSQEKKKKSREILKNDREVGNDEIQKQTTIEEDSTDERDSFEGFYPNDIVQDNASREVDNQKVPAHSEPEQLSPVYS